LYYFIYFVIKLFHSLLVIKYLANYSFLFELYYILLHTFKINTIVGFDKFVFFHL